MNYLNKREQIFPLNLIICCILPNFIGVLYSSYIYYKEKSTKYAILFLSCFVLFLTYNFYSVDNTLRYIRAVKGLDIVDILNGNPLDYVLGYILDYTPLQSSHVFYVYILTIYICWYFIIKEEQKKNKLHTFIILLIFSISIRYVIDLLYFTMSIIITLLLLIKNENNFKSYHYILLFILAYLIHPGVFIILAPSLCIHYAMNLNNKRVYYLSLFLVYIIGLILSSIKFQQTGIPVLDSVFETFNNYTSEGKWGIREDKLEGYTYTILFYIIPIFHYCIFYMGLKNYKALKFRYPLCIFQSACLLYPSMFSFVTLTERILLTMMISSCLILYQLSNIRKIKRLYVNTIVTLIFIFNFFKCSYPIFLDGIFKRGTYESIQLRSYYTPSVLLIDYKDFGFSDQFIKNNSLVYSKFYN